MESKPSEINLEFLNTPNRSPPELLLQVNVTSSLTVVHVRATRLKIYGYRKEQDSHSGCASYRTLECLTERQT